MNSGNRKNLCRYAGYANILLILFVFSLILSFSLNIVSNPALFGSDETCIHGISNEYSHCGIVPLSCCRIDVSAGGNLLCRWQFRNSGRLCVWACDNHIQNMRIRNSGSDGADFLIFPGFRNFNSRIYSREQSDGEPLPA